MKTIVFALFLSVTLFSCKQEKLENTYTPRVLNVGESFNEFPKEKGDALKIVKIDSGRKEGDLFVLKFRDTAILILDKPKPLANRFYQPRFLNTQKTAALVQVADGSGLVSPFYIVSLKNEKPEVIKLDRPSAGANDSKVTAGLQELSLSTVLINNDYIVTLINGKVYPVKRQNEAERIQGKFLFNSSDKKTLVFATANSLYQVNYITGETVNLSVPAATLNPETVASNVQQNYHFKENSKGSLFLEKNDDNKIVDISEFKK
ncbi:hypothetical protein [Pedobacter rhodius]|uniref:Uncharacterized protein n=1 Tax=Pedobacter rhodius TaxID=3004098 RepID=A0ABT4KST3_9SPHI|nr:hypothetical protein [Pedobacter sp. SJ11]MCZ4221894.1 hypothetical protein [Pedobacter sp. SJ11]